MSHTKTRLIYYCFHINFVQYSIYFLYYYLQSHEYVQQYYWLISSGCPPPSKNIPLNQFCYIVIIIINFISKDIYWEINNTKQTKNQIA